MTIHGRHIFFIIDLRAGYQKADRISESGQDARKWTAHQKEDGMQRKGRTLRSGQNTGMHRKGRMPR